MLAIVSNYLTSFLLPNGRGGCSRKGHCPEYLLLQRILKRHPTACLNASPTTTMNSNTLRHFSAGPHPKAGPSQDRGCSETKPRRALKDKVQSIVRAPTPGASSRAPGRPFGGKTRMAGKSRLTWGLRSSFPELGFSDSPWLFPGEIVPIPLTLLHREPRFHCFDHFCGSCQDILQPLPALPGGVTQTQPSSLMKS